MCGGGGGAEEFDELESKRALAEQAAIQLRQYGEVFVPLENQFIADQQAKFGENQYQDVMGRASTGTTSLYEQGMQNAIQGSISRGFNPASGAFQGESMALREAQARAVGQTAGAAGLGQTDSAYQGLGQVVAMGQGQSSDAMMGNIDRLRGDLDLAEERARMDFNKSQSYKSIVGTGAGMATAGGMGMYNRSA